MLDFAAAEDRKALEKIWRTCFGDPQEYLDFYYGKRFVPSDTLVWRENGVPVSMMTLMDVIIAGEKGAYIYAVATLPEYRGRGLVRQLDAFAGDVIRSRGGSFSTLVPANRSLFAFYEKFGYHAEFDFWLGEISPKAGEALPVQPCDFAEFARRRETFLAGIPGAVFHPRKELSYVYEEFSRFSGKFYRIGGDYAACIRSEEDLLLVRECSAEQPVSAVSALLRHFGLQKAMLRSPRPFPGAERVPYGMGKLLDGGKPLAAHFSGPFYMSLMLD